jgi:thiamine-phosphate diphosphorylase
MSAVHHLQLVTDSISRTGLSVAVEAAGGAGIDSLQLRDPSASARALFERTLALARAIRPHDVRLLVNDRVDVALGLRAHGVHLGARSLPADLARALLEPWQLVGVSVHSVDEALAGASAGADYLVFGHVFPTRSHPDEAPRGVGALAALVEAVDVPVLAVGGITPARVAEVLETRCAGVAVISAVLDAQDPRTATFALRRALDAVSIEPKRPFPERRD